MQFKQTYHRRMRADCASCARRLLARSIGWPIGAARRRQPPGPARAPRRPRARTSREPSANPALVSPEPRPCLLRFPREPRAACLCRLCALRMASRDARACARAVSKGLGGAPRRFRASPARARRGLTRALREPRVSPVRASREPRAISARATRDLRASLARAPREPRASPALPPREPRASPARAPRDPRAIPARSLREPRGGPPRDPRGGPREPRASLAWAPR